MKLTRRIEAITSLSDLTTGDSTLDEALTAEDSADAVPAALAALERFLPVIDDWDSDHLCGLVKYVERCGRDERFDRPGVCASVAASLGRVPCEELLEVLVGMTDPARAAQLLVGAIDAVRDAMIVPTPRSMPIPRVRCEPIKTARHMLSGELATLLEKHRGSLEPERVAAITHALTNAGDPVFPFTHDPEDLAEDYRLQRHYAENGEYYQDELWLSGGGFSYTDRWVGCNDSSRSTRRGAWTLWLTGPDRPARADFVERFGPQPLAPHAIETYTEHDATDALVELMDQHVVSEQFHSDPQDEDSKTEGKVRAGRGTLMRVYVHRHSGLLALGADTGLLEQYDFLDDDDWF